MCTYETSNVEVTGSGKGPDPARGPAGWFKLSRATVYFDHPVHAQAGHTLNIDFANPGIGPAARVAVELDPASARSLACAILEILDSAPAALASEA